MQYPFFALCAFLFFLSEQAHRALTNFAANHTPGYYYIPGFNQTLLMYLLCFLAILTGYTPSVKKKKIDLNKRRRISTAVLLICGMYLTLLSYGGLYGLSTMSGGFLAFFSAETGNYALEWTGKAVAFNFVIRLIYPGLFLLLILLLREKKTRYWFPVIFAALIPVLYILILGRRSHVISLALIVLFANYFVNRKIPARKSFIVVGILGFLALNLMGAIRKYTTLGSDYSQILEVSYGDMVAKNEIIEFNHARKIIYAHNQDKEFGYGALFVNSVVQNFIPTLIVPRSIKNRLFIPTFDLDKLTVKHLGWRWSNYSFVAPTGPAEIFQQFWYLGCLVYFLVAKFYYFLWRKADGGSVFHTLYYTSLAWVMILSITNNFYLIIIYAIYYLAFFMPILPFIMNKRLI